MKEIKAGCLAKAKAGREKGEIFLITKVEDEYVYLVDGIYRTLEKPKKKKIKHIQIIHQEYDIIGLNDTQIKRILKVYRQEGKQEES